MVTFRMNTSLTMDMMDEPVKDSLEITSTKIEERRITGIMTVLGTQVSVITAAPTQKGTMMSTWMIMDMIIMTIMNTGD